MGRRSAASIREFFDEPANLKMLKRLREAGVKCKNQHAVRRAARRSSARALSDRAGGSSPRAPPPLFTRDARARNRARDRRRYHRTARLHADEPRRGARSGAHRRRQERPGEGEGRVLGALRLRGDRRMDPPAARRFFFSSLGRTLCGCAHRCASSTTTMVPSWPSSRSRQAIACPLASPGFPPTPRHQRPSIPSRRCAIRRRFGATGRRAAPTTARTAT